MMGVLFALLGVGLFFALTRGGGMPQPGSKGPPHAPDVSVSWKDGRTTIPVHVGQVIAIEYPPGFWATSGYDTPDAASANPGENLVVNGPFDWGVNPLTWQALRPGTFLFKAYDKAKDDGSYDPGHPLPDYLVTVHVGA